MVRVIVEKAPGTGAVSPMLATSVFDDGRMDPSTAEIDRALEQVKIYEAQQVAATKEQVRLTELLKKGGASQSQVDAADAATKLPWACAVNGMW